MNAMAGGGSFISFPAMLGMGVLPVQANATNTVALWPGQLTSLATLRGDLHGDLVPTIAIVSLLGGVSGAEVLLHTRQRTFLHMIPWLILGGTLIFGVSGPSLQVAAPSPPRKPLEGHACRIPRLPLALALFPVCFYIGYFGAGGGFLVMTILALFGMEEMHSLNAMKVVAATALELLRHHHLHLPGLCHRLALLPAGDGLRRARRLDRRALRPPRQRRRPASDRRRHRLRHRGLLLLETVLNLRRRMTLTPQQTDLVGYVAATLTTVSFLPQLIRVVKTRSARDISLGMFLIFSVGTLLWMLYGIFSHSAPVWIANAVTLILSVSILVLKLIYDERATDPNQPGKAPR
jgi:uncharacterized protein with PQ loop repeat